MPGQRPERQPQIRLQQTAPLPMQAHPGQPVTVTMHADLVSTSYAPYDYIWHVAGLALNVPHHAPQCTFTVTPPPTAPGQEATLANVAVSVVDIFGQVAKASAPARYRTAPQQQPQVAPPAYVPPPPTYVPPPPAYVPPPPPRYRPQPPRNVGRNAALGVLSAVVIVLLLVGVVYAVSRQNFNTQSQDNHGGNSSNSGNIGGSTSVATNTPTDIPTATFTTTPTPIPLTVSIIAPVASATVHSIYPFVFVGSATVGTMNLPDSDLVWTASCSGPIGNITMGTGSHLTFAFHDPTNDPYNGSTTCNIMLSATSSSTVSKTVAITLARGYGPTIKITSPTYGVAISRPYTFTGTVKNPYTGENMTGGSFKWHVACPPTHYMDFGVGNGTGTSFTYTFPTDYVGLTCQIEYDYTTPDYGGGVTSNLDFVNGIYISA